jgi:hypothetical protein
MESMLWAIDLIAVAGLCLWALRRDKREDQDKRKGGG